MISDIEHTLFMINDFIRNKTVLYGMTMKYQMTMNEIDFTRVFDVSN